MDPLTTFITELFGSLTISRPIVVMLTIATGFLYKNKTKYSNRWLLPILLVLAPILELLAVLLTNGFTLTAPFLIVLGNAIWAGLQDVAVSQLVYQFWKSTMLGKITGASTKGGK